MVKTRIVGLPKQVVATVTNSLFILYKSVRVALQDWETRKKYGRVMQDARYTQKQSKHKKE